MAIVDLPGRVRRGREVCGGGVPGGAKEGDWGWGLVFVSLWVEGLRLCISLHVRTYLSGT